MKLTVIGATGGTGRHVVAAALAAGHQVTAVARNPDGLPEEARKVRVDFDATIQADVESAVRGSDAVLSCLGARSRRSGGVCARGTRSVVNAMHATGVRRLVVISSESMTVIATRTNPNPPKHDPGEGFVLRYLVGPLVRNLVLKDVYADLGAMEDVVRDSGLDWTLARPAGLTDGKHTGVWRTAIDRKPFRGGFTISRADLAHFLLDTADDPDTVGLAITVCY